MSRLAELATGRLGRFIVTGVLTVCIDAIVYTICLWLGVETNLAKLIGFASGTVFSFVVNRQWTFEADRPTSLSEIAMFVAGYGIGAAINVAVNAAALYVLADRIPYALAIAYLIAVAASATWNFIAMSFVFKKRAS